MKFNVIYLIGFCLLSAFSIKAQETAIFNGTHTDCGGFITDSGLSAGDYGNNQNFTLTICPEAPETVASITWLIFNLGTGDFMSVYDGSDISAPLFGTFATNEIQSDNFSPSEANTAGCLTIVFTSDGTGVGNFALELTCGYPCEVPFAIVNTLQNEEPLLVCVGEEIDFSGLGSTVAAGFAIDNWEWHMGDETVLSGSGEVSHSYDEPGGYRVQLFIIDNNDCANTNLSDFQVFVSTEPSFAGTTANQLVCVDQPVTLTGVVTGSTWNELPDSNLGGSLFIPDDQNQCFSSGITFTNFSPGQEVEQVSDLVDFYINFEHSFMGDLTISFICPNGQSLMVHQQGGGGTFLGVPVDLDEFPNDEGTGFDYWWSPTASNGTWEDNGLGNTLASGTYESFQPWTELIGCPLNGTWTIEICDLWASDNGFIFDWGVSFNPELFPDLIEFTPTFDMGPTDTFWTGPNIVSSSADNNEIGVLHATPGTYVYTYHAIDNFGCEYTQDVNVQVEPRPIVEASTIGSPCGDDPTLVGTISNPNPLLGQYSYIWTPSNLVVSPNASQTATQNVVTNTTFIISVFPTNNPGCSALDEITIFVEEVPPLMASVPDQPSPCPGTEVTLTVTASQGYPPYTYLWSNGDTTATTSVSPTLTTTYEVSIFDQCGDLVQSADVNVTIPGTVITAIDVVGCVNFPTFIGNMTGGTGNYSVDIPEGISFNPEFFTVISGAPGIYTFDVSDDCQATGVVTVELTDCAPIPNIITPNGDDVNDALTFDGLEYLPGSHLIIWNRWGQVVYESDDYQNDWKGGDLTEGVYYYVLSLSLGDQYPSTLQLVRK